MTMQAQPQNKSGHQTGAITQIIKRDKGLYRPLSIGVMQVNWGSFGPPHSDKRHRRR